MKDEAGSIERKLREKYPNASESKIQELVKIEQRKNKLQMKEQALKKTLREQKRSEDARRKIIIGGAMLAELGKDRVMEVLDRRVKKNKDRVFLGLDPLPQTEEKGQED